MRIYLLLVIALGGISKVSAQQDDLISLRVEREDNLSVVFAALSTRYGLQFGYNPALLEGQSATIGAIEGTLPFVIHALLGEGIDIHMVSPKQVLLRQRAHAQDQHVRSLGGVILDDRTKQPVEDVLVYSGGFQTETISDHSGAFELAWEDDDLSQVLILHRVGYDEIFIDLSERSSGSLDTLFIREAPVAMPEIVVRSRTLDHSDSSDRSIFSTRPILQNFAMSGNDVIRGLQRLPGVVAHDDGTAALQIRGSEPTAALVLLDGIPLHRADHFYGIFGAVNGDHISSFTLYKNDFPLEYGGKTAGVLKLEGADVIDEWHGNIDINLLTSSLHLKAPISEKIGLVVSARTTYRNAAETDLYEMPIVADLREELLRPRSQVLQTSPQFNFSDLNAKLIYQMSPTQKLDVNFFRSRDRFQNSYDLTFASRNGTVTTRNNERLRNLESWSSDGMSLNYLNVLNEKYVIKANAYYSDYRSSGEVASFLVRGKEGAERQRLDFANAQQNSLASYGGFAMLEKNENSQKLQIGLTFNQYDNLVSIEEDEVLLLGSALQSYTIGAFSGYTYENDLVSLTLGTRVGYYSGTAKWFLSPRVNAFFQVGDGLKLKGALGYNYQFVQGLDYENRLGQSLNLLVINSEARYPFSRSINAMLGAQFEKGSWTLDAEFYQKLVSGVIEYSLLFPGFDNGIKPASTRNFDFFVGEGTILGADLNMTYSKKRYQGSVVYTLSRNTNSFPRIRHGQSFFSRNDRRHQVKFLQGLSLGAVQIGVEYYFTSGRPYLDLAGVKFGESRRNLIPRSRLPDYHRVDLSLAYQTRLLGQQARLSLSVFNLLDRDNVKYLQYVYSVPDNQQGNGDIRTLVGTETNLLPRTINLGLKVSF